MIVRLATRRIYAVELSEEQIQIIYEMIGDILKKAVENLKNEDKGKEVITILSSDLSTSKRFDEILLDCTDNAYLFSAFVLLLIQPTGYSKTNITIRSSIKQF